jgi:hypothetical protein
MTYSVEDVVAKLLNYGTYDGVMYIFPLGREQLGGWLTSQLTLAYDAGRQEGLEDIMKEFDEYPFLHMSSGESPHIHLFVHKNEVYDWLRFKFQEVYKQGLEKALSLVSWEDGTNVDTVSEFYRGLVKGWNESREQTLAAIKSEIEKLPVKGVL